MGKGMARNCLRISILGVFVIAGVVLFSPTAIAQNANSMSAEALGAKAFLEDLLVRRYGQELSTKLDRNSFVLGAQLDLTQLPPRKEKDDKAPDNEPINDLMLGTIDPEALIKKYSNDTSATVQGFLTNFRIRSVNISAGLDPEVPADTKAEVEKWLNERLKKEFGKVGKGQVSLIVKPPAGTPKPKDVTPEKSLAEWLDQFQDLAGQIILALAIVLGAMLWKLLGGRADKGAADQSTPPPQVATVDSKGGGGDGTTNSEVESSLEDKRDEARLRGEIENYSIQLRGLLPRLSGQIESVVRLWCEMGEEGRLRLACFAEAVGSEIGKLPIPVDAMNDVSKVFVRMSELDLGEKRDALEKAYWDTLTTLNMGAEVLSTPFGYLGSVNTAVVNQVLMDQNPKMRTVVSLFLPKALRDDYVGGLSAESKLELLESAAAISEIPTSELKSLEATIQGKIKGKSSGNTVPLEMSLNKVVDSLSALEQITMLPKIKGPAMLEFKRSFASLAFLEEYPEDRLRVLFERATSDELLAFLRIRTDLVERVLSLCPPMMAEMLKDEVKIEDKMSLSDKNDWLDSFGRRLSEMVQLREIDLRTVFANETSASEDNQESVDEGVKGAA